MSDDTELEHDNEAPVTQEPERRDDDDAAYGARVKKRIGALTARAKQYEQKATDYEQKFASEQARRIEVEKELAKLAVERAREASRAAHTAGDIEAQVAASEQLAMASQRFQAAQNAAPVTQQPQTTYSASTQEWIDENPWFESDAAAKALALRAHGEALASGLTGDSPEYWGFIETKVRRKFPQHFEPETEDESEDQPPPRREVSPVAPARRAAIQPGASKTKLPSLTAQEVDAAKMLGMTHQEYATEKLRLSKEPK